MSKVDASIAIQVSWDVESGCNGGSVTTDTYIVNMNEADPGAAIVIVNHGHESADENEQLEESNDGSDDAEVGNWEIIVNGVIL